ncbi:hypothetical protein [Comamonas jiangduensis]|uniref:hypothetical protein n=1 Tax=Comamonas jiangduensis TaxID=1194168 RepID=UPI0024E04E6C|nr:hypothetical protein [Comamonas jiangduensis]
MSSKTKQCTVGARHKWQFVKNTTNAQAGGRGIGFAVRGVYRCKCGQKKLGDAGHEAHNPLNDLVAAMAGEGKP